MAYYRICPKCGSNLDPGEICDCDQKEERMEVKEAVVVRGGRRNEHIAAAGRGISRNVDRTVRVG